MMKVRPQDLTLERFRKYGEYANMTAPEGPHLGASPCSFYRDMCLLTLNQQQASFSICQTSPRPPIITELEYHDHCGEGILPLDGDVFVQLAPATPHGKPDAPQVEVFRVPMGTMLSIRPGVWHGGPFVCGDETVNVLIVLPERTYANDCIIEPTEPIEIL